jgi:CubicO group peptidase (beta-lactamase class C family)
MTAQLTIFFVLFSFKTLTAQTEAELITQTLNDYIEGTANGQPKRLQNAFHPDFNLYYVTKDSLRTWNGREYTGGFKEGVKSGRIGKIISIDYVNDAATAKIEIDIPGRKRVYTDYLLLLKYGGNWKIVHKSFTFKEYSLQAEKERRIDEILSAYHKNDLFNGSVIVAKNGKEILKKSYGQANFFWNVENTPVTKFRIGSLTKQFTALLILQLKQQGKLKLDDRIAYHLPGYFKKTGSRLTIHHLLSMTSGLPNYTNEYSIAMEREELQPVDFALKYFKDSLLFEPGKSIRYCNTGYYILGLIIEAITKKPYAAVLQERIFNILEMKHSGIETPNQVIPNSAEGYTFYMGEYIVPQRSNVSTWAYSAGAIYSTVEDLFLWDRSFYSDVLLNAENRKLMCSKYLASYGYGVVVEKQQNYLGTNKDITLISHDGGEGGFSSYMARIAEDSIFVVLLDNTRAGMRGGDLVGISNNIIPVLYGLSTTLPKPVALIKLSKMIKSASPDAGIKYFRDTINTNRDAYDFTGLEGGLNSMGYNYLSAGNVADAVKILTLNTEIFPNSGNAYDSLAEACLANKQPGEALRYYRKSLALDSKNANAKKMIEKLTKKK